MVNVVVSNVLHNYFLIYHKQSTSYQIYKEHVVLTEI